MDRIYMNRIEGQRRIHIEIDDHEVTNLLDDLKDDPEHYADTRRLLGILRAAEEVFSPTAAADRKDTAGIRDAARQAAGQTPDDSKATCRYCGHEIVYKPWFLDACGPNPPVWSHTRSGVKSCSTRPVGWEADSWPFATPAVQDPDETAGIRDAAHQAAKTCRCPHPADEHSVYGCADDCACEWMPRRGAARQAAGQPSLPRRDATVDPAVCPRCKGDNQDAFELCATCAAAAPSCTCIHPPEEDAGHLLHASYCTAAAEETHIVADDSDDPEHVDDCPGCETAVDHDEHCPTPETHNWGCGCPTDKWPAADARSSIAAHMGTQGNDPTLALLLNRYHEAVARQAVAEHTAAAGQPATQQQTDRAQTADPTAAIEIWARLLCAADAHVYGPEHPTWQSLSSDKLRDDYRKAARWLLPRMTVDRCSGAERAAGLREAADEIERRQNQLDAEIHAEYGELDRDTEIEGAATRAMAARLRRMADEAAR